MSTLPNPADVEAYYAEVYRQPAPLWRGALATVAARHGLDDGPWERARLGRNVVFVGPAPAGGSPP